MRNFRMHFRLHSGGVSARIAIDSIHYYKEDNMKKSVLRKYATLIATVGVNVQKGQEVFIAAELDQPRIRKNGR